MNKRLKYILAVILIVMGLFINIFGGLLIPYYVYDKITEFMTGGWVLGGSEWNYAYFKFIAIIGYLIGIFGFTLLISDWIRKMTSSSAAEEEPPSRLRNELEQARQKAEAEPEKAKPAWDAAQAKLEIYFDRNLRQMDSIFKLSRAAMVFGFVVIVIGILQQDLINPAIIGGAIAEFIGATFILVYRSTIELAATYVGKLARINTVGMAMQILDTISDESQGMKDETKAEIARLLLASDRNLPEDIL